jgi:Partial alpha/beta-hydrolase lipase region
MSGIVQSEGNTSKAPGESPMPLTSPIAAVRFANQAAKPSHPSQDEDAGSAAVRIEWITPQDHIIVTADRDHLPGLSLVGTVNPNALGEEIGDYGSKKTQDQHENVITKEDFLNDKNSKRPHNVEGLLRRAMASSRTNPLFPPLPLYGPPTLLRNLQYMMFRASAFCLSLAFLGVIVLGSAFTAVPLLFRHMWIRLTFRNPDAQRPFFEEEQRRKRAREEVEKAWKKKQSRCDSEARTVDHEYGVGEDDGFIPTEGGPDPLVCNVGYYARRVGLDVEEFKVQTEDGFIIVLWHVYNPAEFIPKTAKERKIQSSEVFTSAHSVRQRGTESAKPKYPVLMIHGLLQSAGAFCTNDDSSLAFYLCKSGYDVWLGNNRCGFTPEHALLSYSDPRMWAWNIRQMVTPFTH